MNKSKSIIVAIRLNEQENEHLKLLMKEHNCNNKSVLIKSLSLYAKYGDNNLRKNKSHIYNRNISPNLRYFILKKYDYTCQNCGFKNDGDKVRPLHIDHIIPFSYGGTTEENNLTVLCSICNNKKSNKINESK